ncbi:MAG TPA: hypothetical protein VGL02_07355 [Streptomyces sp.]
MEGVDPEESRLREAAELKWRTAALHRIRAARPARSGEPGEAMTWRPASWRVA